MWGADAPSTVSVRSKVATCKVLHTKHGLLGYCRKDLKCAHFKDINIGFTEEDFKLASVEFIKHGAGEHTREVYWALWLAGMGKTPEHPFREWVIYSDATI